MITESAAIASLSIWLYLVLARGAFWRLRTIPPPNRKDNAPLPSVAVIVPARNEADVIGSCITSLLRQSYPNSIQVFLVDDDSSDATTEVATRAAIELESAHRLTLVRATTLPPGWKGKLWALSQGVEKAAESKPDYFLLTDADVVHSPQDLVHLVLRAEEGNFDLVSLMVKLQCQTWAERALIPPFVFFFFMLYPAAWVASPDRRTAAAAGGCILIRRAALERVGGIASIRDQLIDDCALARGVKKTGRIWLGVTQDTYSARGYGSWSGIERMIARSAFTQLRHSTFVLMGTVAAMVITYLAPPFLLFTEKWAAVAGAAAWILMMISFAPTLRFYGRSWLWAPLLPLIAGFYLAATIHSAVLYWLGRGGYWKGRVQDPTPT